jgi:hypothetical protein
MLAQDIPVRSRRGALRRAVQLECSIRSPLWDGDAWYLATDVSPHGMWLSTDLALELGEPLMLSFRPPRWPEWCWPITAFGEVVRVSLSRRRSDQEGAAGMAVRFTEIDPVAREEMALLLRGLPPPLPHRRSLPLAIDPNLPQVLLLDDGSCFELRAEGALLTAGRKVAPSVAAPASADAADSAKPPARRRRTRARKRARELTRRPRRARGKRQPPKLRLVS